MLVLNLLNDRVGVAAQGGKYAGPVTAHDFFLFSFVYDSKSAVGHAVSVWLSDKVMNTLRISNQECKHAKLARWGTTELNSMAPVVNHLLRLVDRCDEIERDLCASRVRCR